MADSVETSVKALQSFVDSLDPGGTVLKIEEIQAVFEVVTFDGPDTRPWYARSRQVRRALIRALRSNPSAKRYVTYRGTQYLIRNRRR